MGKAETKAQMSRSANCAPYKIFALYALRSFTSNVFTSYITARFICIEGENYFPAVAVVTPHQCFRYIRTLMCYVIAQKPVRVRVKNKYFKYDN